MTTDELLVLLRQDAARLGIPPPTRRILRRWVDGRVIAARIPKGRQRGINPVWTFSEVDVRYARKIVELKVAGSRRMNELRLHLWANDVMYPIANVRAALIEEFVRVTQRDRRKHRFDYDHRNGKILSKKDQLKFAAQLPPLDAQFVGTPLEVPPEVMLQLVSSLILGDEGRASFSSLMQGEVERITGFRLEDPSLFAGFNNIAGLFGAPDETDQSGEHELRRSTESDLIEGRRLFTEFMGYLGLAQLFFERSSTGSPMNVLQSFSQTEWVVSMLAKCVVQAVRSRNSKK